jgi:hypothetical protein
MLAGKEWNNFQCSFYYVFLQKIPTMIALLSPSKPLLSPPSPSQLRLAPSFTPKKVVYLKIIFIVYLISKLQLQKE